DGEWFAADRTLNFLPAPELITSNQLSATRAVKLHLSHNKSPSGKGKYRIKRHQEHRFRLPHFDQPPSRREMPSVASRGRQGHGQLPGRSADFPVRSNCRK